jgi:hypothetical protein
MIYSPMPNLKLVWRASDSIQEGGVNAVLFLPAAYLCSALAPDLEAGNSRVASASLLSLCLDAVNAAACFN